MTDGTVFLHPRRANINDFNPRNDNLELPHYFDLDRTGRTAYSANVRGPRCGFSLRLQVGRPLKRIIGAVVRGIRLDEGVWVHNGQRCRARRGAARRARRQGQDSGGRHRSAGRLKHAVHNPEIIVDVSRLRDLKDIAMTDDGLHIGALVTHTEIMSSPIIRDMFPALVDAAHTIGAVQTRNLGTLGGNLVTCVPSMDSGPTLIALDASVTVANADGRRQMPLAEFFVGPRKTILKPDDLLVDIVIPKENLDKPPHSRNSVCARARRWRWSMSRRASVDRQRKFQGAADRARRGRAERHSRAEGGSLSRRPQDQRRGDGRSRPHRRNRRKADQRLPRLRRLPARSGRGPDQARARRRYARATAKKKELVA